MNETLALHAIQAALRGDWKQAVTLNEEIAQSNPQDIDALNRLAHASYELGNTDEARRVYRRVLKIDRYNPIASRALKKMKTAAATGSATASIHPSLFIEEPGVTKLVRLLRPGSPRVLSKMCVGLPVALSFKHRSLVVTTKDGVYLGILPDELARQLAPRIAAGNHYEAYVNSIRLKDIGIFLRETRRVGRYRTQPAFLSLANSPTSAAYESTSTQEVDDLEEQDVRHEHDEFL